MLTVYKTIVINETEKSLFLDNPACSNHTKVFFFLAATSNTTTALTKREETQSC